MRRSLYSLFALALSTVCTQAQGWTSSYEAAVNAAKRGQWLNARQEFFNAMKGRKDDSIVPAILSGPIFEPRHTGSGEMYSPNFLAAYCAYKAAIHSNAENLPELLSHAARELEAVIAKGQKSVEAYYFLDQIYVLSDKLEKRIKLSNDFTKSKLNWKVDSSCIAPEDEAIVLDLSETSRVKVPAVNTLALQRTPLLPDLLAMTTPVVKPVAKAEVRKIVAAESIRRPSSPVIKPQTTSITAVKSVSTALFTKPFFSTAKPVVKQTPAKVTEKKYPSNVQIIIPAIDSDSRKPVRQVVKVAPKPKPAPVAKTEVKKQTNTTLVNRVAIAEAPKGHLPLPDLDKPSVTALRPLAQTGTASVEVHQEEQQATLPGISTTVASQTAKPAETAKVETKVEQAPKQVTIPSPDADTQPKAKPVEKKVEVKKGEAKKAEAKKAEAKKAETKQEPGTVKPRPGAPDVFVPRPNNEGQVVDTTVLTGPVVPAPNKYALIIGNGASQMPDMAIPYASDDAQAIRQSLITDAGYEDANIEVVINATAAQLDASVKALASRVADGGTVFIYFAGTGANLAGKDYLAGVDTEQLTDASTMYAKNTMYQAFMQKGAKVFAFFEANRPTIEGHFFGGEVPLVGSIAQMQATLPGANVYSVVRGGKAIGLFTNAFVGVLSGLHSNSIPVFEFGWQVFNRMRRGDTGQFGGSSIQSPTLPVLTNMANDARF